MEKEIKSLYKNFSASYSSDAYEFIDIVDKIATSEQKDLLLRPLAGLIEYDDDQIALIYTILGEREKALRHIEKAKKYGYNTEVLNKAYEKLGLPDRVERKKDYLDETRPENPVTPEIEDLVKRVVKDASQELEKEKKLSEIRTKYFDEMGKNSEKALELIKLSKYKEAADGFYSLAMKAPALEEREAYELFARVCKIMANRKTG